MKISSKPKIAVLTIRNNYPYGGVAKILEVSCNFLKQYFDPTILYLSFDKGISTSLKSLKFNSGTRATKYLGCNSIEVGVRWAFWEPGHYKNSLGQWKEALQKFDYFFVASGTPIAAHPAACLERKFLIWATTSYSSDRSERIKQLKGFRSILNKIATPAMSRIERDILKKSSFVLALSKYAKNEFITVCPSIKKKIAICGCPFDNKKLECISSVVKQLKQTKIENKIILAVGRFSDPRKNIGMLIRVFGLLQKKTPELKLYVAGSKPTKKELIKFEKYECLKKIIFTGQINDFELAKLYKTASLSLITSHQEGFGIVGVDSLAFGVPVISTDCGGIRDFIIDGITGHIVKINDDEAMVAKIQNLFDNSKLLKKISRNAEKFAQENLCKQKTYSVFKYGLSKVYPELESWFIKCDTKRTITQKISSEVSKEERGIV
jgi:glycosyltransferase involved in cell wall biosynthesis